MLLSPYHRVYSTASSSPLVPISNELHGIRWYLPEMAPLDADSSCLLRIECGSVCSVPYPEAHFPALIFFFWKQNNLGPFQIRRRCCISVRLAKVGWPCKEWQVDGFTTSAGPLWSTYRQLRDVGYDLNGSKAL
jgi:hypothetical protein